MAFEEKENERQENEALKNAKEIVKKKNKDKQKQLMWTAVKTAMMPVILLVVKVVIIAVLSVTIISLFSFLLDGGGKSSKAKDDNKKTLQQDQYGDAICRERNLLKQQRTTMQKPIIKHTWQHMQEIFMIYVQSIILILVMLMHIQCGKQEMVHQQNVNEIKTILDI